MNRLFALCVVIAAISEGYAASIRVRRQVIPREFQNINIENYLKNERAVRFQLKCIIDDGPCDRIGKYLKVTIPELLVNQCANCDAAQRERAGKLVTHIQQNFPEDWERAVKKFQGGLVKAEDADKLKSILGITLDPKLVAAPTTAAPATTPAAKPVEVPSTSEVPVSTTSAAPATEATSSAAPVESTSVAAAITSSTTLAAVAPSSTSEAAVVSSTSETAPSSTTAAAAAVPSSSSAAPTA